MKLLQKVRHHVFSETQCIFVSVVIGFEFTHTAYCFAPLLLITLHTLGCLIFCAPLHRDILLDTRIRLRQFSLLDMQAALKHSALYRTARKRYQTAAFL